MATTEGFEPSRAKHNGLAGHRLNHSAKLSHCMSSSEVAQRKRVGLITQRSVDRNHPSLPFATTTTTHTTLHKRGAKGESNPRPLAPKARIIPLDHWPVDTFKSTFGGARTRDHKIKSLALYHLSYEGITYK